MVTTLKYYVITTIVFFSIALAQDSKHEVDVDVDVRGAQWYNNWWVWVIGAVILVLIVVAIVGGRGGGGTTVIREERK